MTTELTEPTLEVQLDIAELESIRREELTAGLAADPKALPAKWLYDGRGSELFDQITRLPEYYPTEAERSILMQYADEIIERAAASTIVELGSGTSDKTRALLDAARRDGTIRRFVAFDVSEPPLRAATLSLAGRYPGLDVHGVVGDFDRHLHRVAHVGTRLVMLLGGTIGNYPPAERAHFLRRIAAELDPGDHLLLGVDLVKSVARMEVAYDDPTGVSAAFAKNILHVINRHLDASFDVDAFEYVARWDDANQWIDMGLRSRWPQRVRVASADLDVEFSAGEIMRTEVSAKFNSAEFSAELAAAGLRPVDWYHDERGDFGLSLSAVET